MSVQREGKGIAWCDRTWNPVTGCSKVSQGCKHCYAEVMAERFFARLYRPVLNDGSGRTIDTITTSAHEDYLTNGLARPRRFTDVQTHPDRLDAPLRWRKPARVFVNSMSDLFHESVPDAFIDRVFAVMALAPQHTFLVLTKRPERMRAYLSHIYRRGAINDRACLDHNTPVWSQAAGEEPSAVGPDWPLLNVWLGVSVEDQATADQRIPLLLQTPAAVRWVSYEPALAGVDFSEWLEGAEPTADEIDALKARGDHVEALRRIRYGSSWLDWIVVGGESGPKARSCYVSWIESVRDQCHAAGVACFIKQLGADPRWPGASSSPIEPARGKNAEPAEWPADLRVREFPAVAS